MLSEKDKAILGYLRRNARANITTIAQATGIPVSTVFDRMKQYGREIIKKHTVLLDFPKLGFHAKAKIAIKVSAKEREKVYALLSSISNVNSLYRINYGYDFFVEVVYPGAADVKKFLHQLESQFESVEYQVYNILEEVKKEVFVP